MKHTTHTATVKEMRTLANTAKKHADDAANSWQQVHNLTAAAHSAANRAATCTRCVKICTLLNLLALIAIAVLTITSL